MRQYKLRPCPHIHGISRTLRPCQGNCPLAQNIWLCGYLPQGSFRSLRNP